MRESIHLGYEVGSGEAVTIPVAHLAVTGQTQASGKTTTLEALVTRHGATALTFVTKRGEASFEDGRRVKPYFRDRADWQFVSSIIDATLQEKNKFLRPWIMKICRTTRTLADVQDRVRDALATAKGINEGVYTQLDAYLDLIVPEIGRADLARKLDLAPGINVMDVSGFAAPMQMLFIQSALDWINEHNRDTVVVIPEAWEFVPEGKGSPVKASAIALVRKGAALRNFIWLDSQDMAGVDKTLLRGCTVWLIGVQREANEIKRNLSNIPAGIHRPSASAVATLERGQFFACYGKVVTKVYVQPAWMHAASAHSIAMGRWPIKEARRELPMKATKEDEVDKHTADQLRADNEELRRQIGVLTKRLTDANSHIDRITTQKAEAAIAPPQSNGLDMDAIYTEVKRRALADPVVLKVLAAKPEIEVAVKRQIINVDHDKQPGFLAAMIASGAFDRPQTVPSVVSELKRRGRSVHPANVSRDLGRLAEQGFLTVESDGYQAVSGMKVNIVEAT